jgi:hypothetical protein
MKKFLWAFALMACVMGTTYAKTTKACLFYYEFEALPNSTFLNDDITMQIVLSPDFTYEVTVKNQTDDYLYLDLGRTFLIVNGTPTTYYVPTSTATSHSSTSGAAVNVGAVAGALGVSGGIGRALNGVNVGGASTSGSTTVVYSERVITLPPHTSYNLETKTISFSENTFQYTNGMNVYEKKEFSKWNSPMTLESSIAYSKHNDCQEIQTIRGGMYVVKTYGIPTSKVLCNFKKKYREAFSEVYPEWNLKPYAKTYNCQRSGYHTGQGLWRYGVGMLVFGATMSIILLSV